MRKQELNNIYQYISCEIIIKLAINFIINLNYKIEFTKQEDHDARILTYHVIWCQNV